MGRIPKYIIVPALLLIYFVVVAVWSIKQRNGELPDNFALTVIVELILVGAVFFFMRKRYRKD